MKVWINPNKEKAGIRSPWLRTQGIHGVKQALKITAVPAMCKLAQAPDNDRGAQTRRIRGQPEVRPRAKLVSVKCHMDTHEPEIDAIGVIALVRNLVSDTFSNILW